jgi:hypothetical protein
VRLIIAPPGGMGACWYWAEKMLGAQLALLLVEDLARLPVRPQHLTRKPLVNAPVSDRDHLTIFGDGRQLQDGPVIRGLDVGYLGLNQARYNRA